MEMIIRLNNKGYQVRFSSPTDITQDIIQSVFEEVADNILKVPVGDSALISSDNHKITIVAQREAKGFLITSCHPSTNTFIL